MIAIIHHLCEFVFGNTLARRIIHMRSLVRLNGLRLLGNVDDSRTDDETTTAEMKKRQQRGDNNYSNFSSTTKTNKDKKRAQ